MKKLLLVLLLITLFIPQVALAETNNRQKVEQKRQEILKRLEERKQERKDLIASRSAQRKEKLTKIRLEVCEKKKDLITNRSTNLITRANRHFDVFERISTRVDNFYVTKLVPQGKTVENYAELKQDLVAQATEVETAIEAAKENIDTFVCTADNPKGQLVIFREEMKLVIAALKDYREAVKNLIVAVKGVVSDTTPVTSSAGN